MKVHQNIVQLNDLIRPRYEKETASSSDVTDTNEDTNKDESDHSIARSFDEPVSEHQDCVSDHNYVNATTELNNEDDKNLH